jgi:hypothetical protein
MFDEDGDHEKDDEMNIRKLQIFVGSVVLALVAPATASAFTIKDGGKTLEGVNIPLTGKLKVQALGSGIECTVDTTISVNVDTVDVTAFNLTTSTCVSFGTLYQNCEIASDEATVPWSVTVNENGLEVPFGSVDITLKPKPGKTCFTKKNDVTLEKAGFYWINDQGKTKPPYTDIEYLAAATVDTDSGKSAAVAEGTFEFVGMSAETYAIA